jgi:hypothetical protein
MATIMIADFAGMLPLRDPILLPDNNAQYANSAWLYRGEVRGYRAAPAVATTKYADTTQVYRIPLNNANPPDFSTAGSLWLEFPDPYMASIRNPTVGDTWNRYYFFPSDQYNSTGVNPSWPAGATPPPPKYGSFSNLPTIPSLYTLGIPQPSAGPPTVTATPANVQYQTTAATGAGGQLLNFATTAGIQVGMTIVDASSVTLQQSAQAATSPGSTVLNLGNTTGILVGMTITDVTNSTAIPFGAAVGSLTPTTVTMTMAASGAGVQTGDVIHFANVAIPANAAVTGINATQVAMSALVGGAGVSAGDVIQFNTQSETRAYIYTYVSQYGEEGPPSAATVATGATTGTWTISIPAPAAADLTGRSIATGAHWRLYRTVTDTSGNATYYQVTEVPINYAGVTIIHDSAPDSVIATNLPLSTIGYSPPPAGLQGVVMMANGIAAGFTNSREVWFSAAYQLHAWPAQYALTVDYPIVGLTANGTSLNIMTEGSPFIATGVTPDTMTIGKITANEPCISRGSIVSAGEGAYYASPNGVQLLNTGGTTNITQYIWEKEFHYTMLPQQWASGKYGLTYVTFIKGAPVPGPQPSLAIAGLPSFSGFTLLSIENDVLFSYISVPVNVTNAMTDELSGQIFDLRADGTIMQWNPPIPVVDTTMLRQWQWQSKKFRFTFPQQFKAFMVLFDVPPEITATLGARVTDQTALETLNLATQYMIVTVYADGRKIVAREVQKSGEVLLITEGFKAELWEFYFTGQVQMKFFKCASSVKELRAA